MSIEDYKEYSEKYGEIFRNNPTLQEQLNNVTNNSNVPLDTMISYNGNSFVINSDIENQLYYYGGQQQLGDNKNLISGGSKEISGGQQNVREEQNIDIQEQSIEPLTEEKTEESLWEKISSWFKDRFEQIKDWFGDRGEDIKRLLSREQLALNSPGRESSHTAFVEELRKGVPEIDHEMALEKAAENQERAQEVNQEIETESIDEGKTLGGDAAERRWG